MLSYRYDKAYETVIQKEDTRHETRMDTYEYNIRIYIHLHILQSFYKGKVKKFNHKVPLSLSLSLS